MLVYVIAAVATTAVVTVTVVVIGVISAAAYAGAFLKQLPIMMIFVTCLSN